MYPHLLLSICSSGKLRLIAHNSSAAVTSSGKQQKMRKCMGIKPALPSSERSQDMHDSWQLCAGLGGGMCPEWTQSPALFRQDGLRRPKVHANTNLENHSCSGSQSWENKSLFHCWLYMALVYSTSQLPWGWKHLSWPLFSPSFKLRTLKIKLEVKQNPGHNFPLRWSILFSLEVSTCLPASSLLLGENGICLAWVHQCGSFSDLSTGDEFSPPLVSSLGMFSEEKENLLLITRDAQAAVKPLVFSALDIICLWIAHEEHHEICASKNASNKCSRN